jgi:hypothetical protein
MFRRLSELCRPLSPQRFLDLDETSLRACGFSRQKRGYARHLAATVRDGGLDFDRLAAADDETALAALCALKGIGRWSAEIYMLFALGRADVWPAADLGLRLAVVSRLGVDGRPDEAALRRLGEAAVAHPNCRPRCIREAGSRSRFRELDGLSRIDQIGVADMAEIGRIDRQIVNAGTEKATGDLPQGIAALHHIGVRGRGARDGGRRSMRNGDRHRFGRCDCETFPGCRAQCQPAPAAGERLRRDQNPFAALVGDHLAELFAAVENLDEGARSRTPGDDRRPVGSDGDDVEARRRRRARHGRGPLRAGGDRLRRQARVIGAAATRDQYEGGGRQQRHKAQAEQNTAQHRSPRFLDSPTGSA